MHSSTFSLVSFFTFVIYANGSPINLEKRAEPLTCSPFKAQGSSSDAFRINFYDNNPNDAPTALAGRHSPFLPANTTSESNWELATSGSGASFKVNSCTSSSLQPSESESCGHSGCYKAYTSYAQVVRDDGLCLSQTNPSEESTYLGWKDCDENKDDSQLFQLRQSVDYSASYASITKYGDISFNLILKGDGNGHYNAWGLDTDDKTLQVIQSDYTQAGLSANLVAA